MIHNPDLFELGKMCAYGHDYNGLGQSLRHKQKNYCFQCRQEYYKKNKARIRQQQQAYYRANPDKYHSVYDPVYQHEYYLKHKEEIKEKRRGYQAEYQREYYQRKKGEIREKRKEYNDNYYQENKEEIKLKKKKRYEKKKQEEQQKRKKRYNGTTPRPEAFTSLKDMIHKQYNY
jgi:hypothetical protein